MAGPVSTPSADAVTTHPGGCGSQRQSHIRMSESDQNSLGSLLAVLGAAVPGSDRGRDRTAGSGRRRWRSEPGTAPGPRSDPPSHLPALSDARQASAHDPPHPYRLGLTGWFECLTWTELAVCLGWPTPAPRQTCAATVRPPLVGCLAFDRWPIAQSAWWCVARGAPVGHCRRWLTHLRHNPHHRHRLPLVGSCMVDKARSDRAPIWCCHVLRPGSR